MVWGRWDAVKATARGVKADYTVDATHIGRGGQATVARAVHRESDVAVAFKRLLPGLKHDPAAQSRMQREIEIGSQYQGPNLVPVLDAAPDGAWFVMPLADGHLEGLRPRVADSNEALTRLVRQMCAGLAGPHSDGWAHRDIKPENVLLFNEAAGSRWAVADWGLGRRPRGSTTAPGRTIVGAAYGSEGFAAPEQGVDAHAVTLAADIYSIGQVIGWVLTGRKPQPNLPRLPDSGPWRKVVEEATRMLPSRRPQTTDDLIALIEAELAPLPPAPVSRGEALLEEASSGTPLSGIRLMELASADPDNEDLLIHQVPQLGNDVITLAVAHHGDILREVLTEIKERVDINSYLSYPIAGRVVEFAARCYKFSLDRRDVALADVALEAACAWDGVWDQWGPQKSLKSSLRTVRGPAAEAAARVLRRHPDSASHFDELADEKRVESAIRGVLADLRRDGINS